jgi:hypothetical protein
MCPGCITKKKFIFLHTCFCGREIFKRALLRKAVQKQYLKLAFFFSFAIFFLYIYFFTVMEILKSDFEQKLPFIKKAILEADFIAIDCEFTGKYHDY